jgi:2-dehydro-3-deoxyphosphogluconate aldolase/(4S)-4-hydroxy-2-oxoglutarate aldolase
MREELIKLIEEEKLIVIVRGIEKEKLIPLAEAMYNAGIRLLEVTYSQKGTPSDEEVADSIRLLSEHFKGRMFIGSGTTITKKQVALTKKAGGSFIISPDANSKVIKATRKAGLVSIPGALTPTEIASAHGAGADFVKLFPITNLGTSYFKAVKAPLSSIKYLAVGGIDENNMQEYLSLGISGFGIGSNIVNKKLIDANEFEKITELAKKYVEAVKSK